jgi:hypothetical protein
MTIQKPPLAGDRAAQVIRESMVKSKGFTGPNAERELQQLGSELMGIKFSLYKKAEPGEANAFFEKVHALTTLLPREQAGVIVLSMM